MEYCELGDLSFFIKKREKLITNPATHDLARKYPNPPNSGLNEVITRHFLKQLASALEFLRQGNFVHRDVKPQNLLLLPSPQFRDANRTSQQIMSASRDSLTPAVGIPSLPMLKLADFGFARVLPSTSLAETLCGSPLYMAPEILRYERYDAKADLWSVGTVAFEMVTGKPPFKATNHVELLRRIEAGDDSIRFSRDCAPSTEMKSLIRGLLKRKPVERMTFAEFFAHPVITDPIPGLVEDDIPKSERRAPRETKTNSKTDEPPLIGSRRPSLRRPLPDQEGARDGGTPPSPKSRRSSPLSTPVEPKPNPLEQAPNRMSYSPRLEAGEGLGIRRPVIQPSTSAPTRPISYPDRRRRMSNASLKTPIREAHSPPSSDVLPEASRNKSKSNPNRHVAEVDQAAQDVADEREYVVVDKKHLEVNALADQISLYPQPHSPKSGQMVRRATQQGNPTSVTGAVPTPASRGLQIAQGRNEHYRSGSYDKTLSSSPGSATSVISKAIQDASLRLFGFKYSPHLLGKGQSPPQIYSPFPAYPTPPAPAGLISDGKQSTPVDEDTRVAQCIEDYATRSDVVYGFAEVKYKQFVPMAPSAEHGLGGISPDKMSEEDLGLTVEAVVALSEEALVLYVKALSLLAKPMDIASMWWTRKTRTESSSPSHSAARDSSNAQALAMRINSAVQWIRGRFNEVLEKTEIVRLKLIEAQKQLPEDHPSHPSNHPTDAISTSSSSVEGVFLTAGISAEKLMYDRALEMSRAAAINEIASEDLSGCEISYVTAIRMLEAVLETEDDHLPKRRFSSGSREEKPSPQENTSEMTPDDQQAVQKGTTILDSPFYQCTLLTGS